MAPLALFPPQGLTPDKDYKILFSGKHDSSVMGVNSGDYDAAAVDELIARVDAEDLREPLALALGELPADQRGAVIGRVGLGLGYERLAEASGTTEEALRARVSRGLRALRIRLSGGRP